MRISYINLALAIGSILLLAGCDEERRPRSADEFVENPIMLEAAMVRCSQDRTATRYDAECINARRAVKEIETKEEALRQSGFDARSESKLRELRRSQEAAAEARRRTAKMEKQREEAEYLAQFGVVATDENELSDEDVDIGNSPLVVIPEVEEQDLTSGYVDVAPAIDGGNASGTAPLPEEDTPPSDLVSIRDVLQRRNNDADSEN
jgi:hypothetical protein